MHPSHALKLLLRRLRRIEDPRILDLGPAEGVNLEFFTGRGFRVSVENFVEAIPEPTASKYPACVSRPAVPREPLRMLASRRPEEEPFDAIFCWDLLDLLGVEAARDLVLELRSRLRHSGLVWALFDSSRREAPAALRRFRILGEESLEHQHIPERPVTRFLHQNRDIIRMFDGFEVLSSTFLRVGVREMLFARAVATAV